MNATSSSSSSSSQRGGLIGRIAKVIPGIYPLARWFDDSILLPWQLRRAGWHFGPNYRHIGKKKCLGMLNGSFEGETLAVIRKVVPAGCVAVDVGANFGYFTRALSDLVGSSGRVVAFEAHPDVFQWLSRNVAGRSNVVLRNLAASEGPGEITFNSMDNPLAHSMFATGEHTGTWTVQKRITVPTVAIDDVLAELGVGSGPLVVKMDIEGAEPMALAGLARTFETIPDIAIVVEYHPACLESAGRVASDMLRQLWDQGFTLYPIEFPAEQVAAPASAQWHVNLLCVRGSFATRVPPGIHPAIPPGSIGASGPSAA